MLAEPIQRHSKGKQEPAKVGAAFSCFSSRKSLENASSSKKIDAVRERAIFNERLRYQDGIRDSQLVSPRGLSLGKIEGLFSVTVRAAAPIRTAASTPAATASLSHTLALSRRGRTDKSVVDVNCLFKQLGTIKILDGLGSLRESRVFDQCVSLA